MSETSRKNKGTALTETTGAVSTTQSVASVVKTTPVTPQETQRGGATKARHQTHGAVTPITGPITNVSQLMNRGRNIAKGSAGSFKTMGEYTTYVRTLSLNDLHRHAVEDARIVPIDDRERLIRRLETAWTANASRYPGTVAAAIPQRPAFSQEQMATQQALRDKLLRR